MRALVGRRLAHLLLASRPDLLPGSVPHLLTLWLVHTACWWWPLRGALLVRLARACKLPRVGCPSLRVARLEGVASARNLLTVATHSLRTIRLLRKEASRAGTASSRGGAVEIVRCSGVLGIYWLRQLGFLSRLRRLQGGVSRSRALRTSLIRHQALTMLLFGVSAIAHSFAALRQEIVHFGRAHCN